MPKKTAKQLTPEEIALRHNPGYEARKPGASDAARQVAADVAVPEADALKAKYGAPAAKGAGKSKGRGKDLSMVALRAKTPSDSRIADTVSVVDGDREVGHRG